MKRFLAYLCVICLLCAALTGCIGQKTASNPPDSGSFLVHARVPEDWGQPNLWAWSVIWGDLFPQWPGEAMQYDGSWYTLELPGWVENVIINGLDGQTQTADLPVDPEELWIIVNEDNSAVVDYVNPDMGQVTVVGEGEYYIVRVMVPAAWQEVSLWAWSDAEGELFDQWPGMALEKAEDGWYTLGIPRGFDNVLINANGGSVQTADILTTGRDCWITVYDNATHTVSLVEPEPVTLPSSNTAAGYDAVFADMGLADQRVVTGGLSRMAMVQVTDKMTLKMEYGFDSQAVREMAVTYYYSVSGYGTQQKQDAANNLKNELTNALGHLDAVAIFVEPAGNYLMAVLYCDSMDDPSSAEDILEFFNMGDGTAMAGSLELMPSAQYAEASGFYVKYD